MYFYRKLIWSHKYEYYLLKTGQTWTHMAPFGLPHIRLVQLLFSAETVFFSHNISIGTVFSSQFQQRFSQPNGAIRGSNPVASFTTSSQTSKTSSSPHSMAACLVTNQTAHMFSWRHRNCGVAFRGREPSICIKPLISIASLKKKLHTSLAVAVDIDM